MRHWIFGCFALWGVSTVALPRTLVVNQKSIRASDSNPGTEARPLKTISAAAKLAQPGDTVFVRAGVYRERVAPARGGEEGKPITYEAAAGEQAFVKGSEEWHPAWQAIPGHPEVWFGKLDPAIFGGFNPFVLSVEMASVGPNSRELVPKRVRPVAEGASQDPLPPPLPRWRRSTGFRWPRTT